jgi:polyhydroxyalkanoate synthase
MQAKGYLDGRIMATVFNTLRANDLIWASFINNYLKGQKSKPFDLLYWNADATNIPSEVHSFYLRNMYLNNLLTHKNKLALANVPLDLSKINIPSYFLAAQDDHIVPWTSCYKGSHLLNGEKTFVLTRSGHVAGVVNPPHKKKYGYWINNNTHQTHEQFLISATFIQDSWWNHWLQWQKKHLGKCRLPYDTHNKNQEKLEDAPGSFVKMHVS